MRKLLFLLGLGLLPSLSFGFVIEDTPIERVQAQADQALENFLKFYSEYIAESGAKPTPKESLQAARDLATYWNSKGIYCRVMEGGNERIRVQILPPDKIVQSIAQMEALHGKDWMRALQDGTLPEPQPLCYQAADIWDKDPAGELFYHMAFATDETYPASHGKYTWDGEYKKHLNGVLLPADFPGHLVLEHHPGAQFALTQHILHQMRVNREVSPYHVRIDSIEAARISAYSHAISLIKSELRALNAGELTDDEYPQSVRFMQLLIHYITDALNETRELQSKLVRLKYAYEQREIHPKFESDWADIVRATLSKTDLKTKRDITGRFYLVALDSADDTELGRTELSKLIDDLNAKLSEHLREFASEKRKLDNYVRTKDLDKLLED